MSLCESVCVLLLSLSFMDCTVQKCHANTVQRDDHAHSFPGVDHAFLSPLRPGKQPAMPGNADHAGRVESLDWACCDLGCMRLREGVLVMMLMMFASVWVCSEALRQH